MSTSSCVCRFLSRLLSSACEASVAWMHATRSVSADRDMARRRDSARALGDSQGRPPDDLPHRLAKLTRVNPFFSNEKPGRRSLSSTSGDFGKFISKSLARANPASVRPFTPLFRQFTPSVRQFTPSWPLSKASHRGANLLDITPLVLITPQARRQACNALARVSRSPSWIFCMAIARANCHKATMIEAGTRL